MSDSTYHILRMAPPRGFGHPEATSPSIGILQHGFSEKPVNMGRAQPRAGGIANGCVDGYSHLTVSAPRWPLHDLPPCYILFSPRRTSQETRSHQDNTVATLKFTIHPNASPAERRRWNIYGA